MRYCQARHVLARRAGSHWVLLAARGEDAPVTLSGSGAVLWEVLATGVTVEEAAAVLADVYGAEAAVVAGDVARAVAELCRRGLVEADDGSGGGRAA